MDAKFIVLEGKGLDRNEFPLVGSGLLVGRSASCDIPIDHGRVSLEHCRITRREDGRIVVEDLHSTYGTFLNDHDIEVAALHDGDCLRIGPVVLLCVTDTEPSAARRRALEKYLVGTATGKADPDDPSRGSDDDSPIVSSARQIFERIAGREDDGHGSGMPTGVASQALTTHGRTGRLRVEFDAGVAFVDLLDRAIIHENEIQQIGGELEDLIRDGKRRILIDFGNVRHLSSQAVSVLIRAQRRLSALGGALKVCNPNPEVAEVFKITNMTRTIEIHVDEDAALRAGWPDTAADSPAAGAVAAAQAPLPADPRIKPVAAPRPAADTSVRLVIGVGKSRGKTIPIPGPRFLIGRDPRCQLRPASEAISRVHTRIEIREGRVFVRDLGTTNGTYLGDRLLLGEEVEARDGDDLRIGPLAFTFAIASQAPPMAPPIPAENIEDAAASWLLQGVGEEVGETALRPLPDAEAALRARRRALDELRRTRSRIVGDVTVVTVVSPVLRDEAQIAPVRHELISLQDQPVPRRLVLRLGQVTDISSLAIAMILGHFQRLDRLGGGLRLCELHPNVAPAIEEALLTSPIRIYPNIEEALRDPWPIT